jgi:hypothetical protein
VFGNRFGLAVVIGLLPAVVLGVFLTQGSSDFPALPWLLVLMWLIAVGGALYRIRNFRCPRCAKTFSVAGWWSPTLRGRKCMHCGLELGS